MRRALASVCAFASNVLLAVGFALALLSHFLESERSVTMSDKDRLQQSQDAEDREQRRIDRRNAWFVGLFMVLTVVTAVYFKWIYTPQSDAQPDPAITVTSCAITVNSKSGTITLRPGDNMTLEVRCPTATTVDVGIATPEMGVVGVYGLPRKPDGAWGDEPTPIPPDSAGTVIHLHAFRDGQYADSVTVRVR